MTTDTTPNTPAPRHDDHRELRRHLLLLWLLAVGTALAFTGYVFHRHPGFRETAVAVGGVGTFLLTTVLAARGRR
ncbi:hypothetical protein [Streptomyces sp. DH37]|uniref:hypothetical protein n=1 Tax=Streptomyces sp. DH37 TaxID=3040122 RepID=UPI0024426139|nr:hypothetical protein [Streptomyces sp. DH37]MDG9705883.1 hypothetical protein [Streptomyces sp. DH37]